MKKSLIIPYVGVASLAFGLGWTFSTNTTFNKIIHNNTTVITTIPFSEAALIEQLNKCNIKYPHIVLAQAKLESSNFSSENFKKNNNLVGLRKARRRVTTSLSEKNTYAYYRDWVDCIYDICMWQSSFANNASSEEEYFRILQEKYAEDPQYVNKLKNIIEKGKLRAIFED
jgi:flagellum-specific peptidoglycan hydrolase FlgJ